MSKRGILRFIYFTVKNFIPDCIPRALARVLNFSCSAEVMLADIRNVRFALIILYLVLVLVLIRVQRDTSNSMIFQLTKVKTRRWSRFDWLALILVHSLGLPKSTTARYAWSGIGTFTSELRVEDKSMDFMTESVLCARAVRTGLRPVRTTIFWMQLVLSWDRRRRRWGNWRRYCYYRRL